MVQFQPLAEEKENHGGRGGAICVVGTMWAFFYFLLWILIFPDWTHSAWQLEDNLMGRVKRFNGLFLRCISPKEGGFKCDNYGKPTFVLGTELQAQRALMVIAVVFSFFGLVVGIISLSCTNMIDNRSKKKSFIGLASGLCFFISGACTLITTIWFGVNVRRQYYDPLHKNDSFKYEFGSCLYVGWVAGPLTLISGLVLLIGSCRKLKDRTDEYKPPKQFVYKPPTNSFVKPSGEKAEYV